jgi:hypothetical protein
MRLLGLLDSDSRNPPFYLELGRRGGVPRIYYLETLAHTLILPVLLM